MDVVQFKLEDFHDDSNAAAIANALAAERDAAIEECARAIEHAFESDLDVASIDVVRALRSNKLADAPEDMALVESAVSGHPFVDRAPVEMETFARRAYIDALTQVNANLRTKLAAADGMADAVRDYRGSAVEWDEVLDALDAYYAAVSS